MRTCTYFEDLPENAQVYYQFWLWILKKALNKKLSRFPLKLSSKLYLLHM